MIKKVNWSALVLMLVLYFISFYSLYASMYDYWRLGLPNGIIFMFSIVALLLAILGFQDKSNIWAKIRSWITTVLSSLLILVLGGVLTLTGIFAGSKELLTTTHSPDQKYTIYFYKTDAGAMGSFGIMGELKGPLSLRKVVYQERKVDQVNVKWINNHTVIINDHELVLEKKDS